MQTIFEQSSKIRLFSQIPKDIRDLKIKDLSDSLVSKDAILGHPQSFTLLGANTPICFKHSLVLHVVNSWIAPRPLRRGGDIGAYDF